MRPGLVVLGGLPTAIRRCGKVQLCATGRAQLQRSARAILAGGLLAFCLTLPTDGQTLLQNLPVQSASGQFSVLTPTFKPSPPFNNTGEEQLLRLDPPLLIVSAERLRQYLCQELGDNSMWSGRIMLSLRPAKTVEDDVKVVSEWSGRGWQYRMSLPDQIKADRYVRAMIEINLLEMANRHAAGHSAEIPAWLTEGLTGQLLSSRAMEIVLPPPRYNVNGLTISPWVVEHKRWQPLSHAHEQLQTNAPLSVEELSWPTPDSFHGVHGQVYRDCAQLLFDRLVELPAGRTRLREFITRLPQHFNWQITFLETFHTEFPRLLDLEKWWALQVVHFTGRDLSATYPFDESALRLDQVVRYPVEVRLSTNDLPVRREMKLQTILREWQPPRQTQAIQSTITELALLRARVAPELLPLVDGYREALERFLHDRDAAGLYLPKGFTQRPAVYAALRRALKDLDDLDSRLAAVLPASSSPDSPKDVNTAAAH